MAYLIDRINQELTKTGYTERSNRARDWLRSKIKELKPTPSTLLRDKERLRNTQFIGGMFFFYYDPKTKDTLPYYDRFPLVIPIERYKDGFLGLNLHYISPKQRIILLDKLSMYKNNDKYDNTTKLRLSYDLLSRTTLLGSISPCIKRYLMGHVRSDFIEITANEWDKVAQLPVQIFITRK